MKRFLIATLTLISLSSFAQNNYKHPPILSISLIQNDFKNKYPLSHLKKLDAGLSASFTKGINKRFDWIISYAASFPDSFSKKMIPGKENSLLSKLDFSIRTRLFPTETRLQRYLQTGIGLSFIQNKLSNYFVVGPGVQFR